jgi:hypothetical protein
MTGAVETASKDEVYRLFYFVELDLDSGLVNVTNIDRNIIWDGKTWNGVGDAGGIVGVKETVDLSVSGITMLLAGIESTYWNTVLTTPYSGRRCTVWAAFFDEDDVIVADPIIIFQGQLDTIAMEAGETATIEVKAENELVRWQIPKEFRYTNADQKARFPDDDGFEFVAQVVEKVLIWGGGGVQAPLANDLWIIKKSQDADTTGDFAAGAGA